MMNVQQSKDVSKFTRLVRDWMDQLQDTKWDDATDYLNFLEGKQKVYNSNMQGLLEFLKSNYGFAEEDFYKLQDDALLLQ